MRNKKEAKAKILNNTVTLLAGSAGSGKTLLACQIALEKLFMRDIDKIIITTTYCEQGGNRLFTG